MIERERKFLVKPEKLDLSGCRQFKTRQGYLASENGITVRIRIVNDVDAVLCFKRKRPEEGYVNDEIERTINLYDGQQLLSWAPYKIKKTRYVKCLGEDAWEIDVFEDMNGLILAEIETEKTDDLILPEWIDREVFGIEYTNDYLSKHGWQNA